MDNTNAIFRVISAYALLALALFVGYDIGYRAGMAVIREEAIRHNAAKYECANGTDKCGFVWKKQK